MSALLLEEDAQGRVEGIYRAMARMTGATPQQIIETKEVVELFSSFTAIADSLRVPLDDYPKK